MGKAAFIRSCLLWCLTAGFFCSAAQTISDKAGAAIPAAMADTARPTGMHAAYTRPRSFGFVTHVPDDLRQIAKTPFEDHNWKWMTIVAASTAALLPFDQDLQNGVKQMSRNLDLDPQTGYKVFVKAGDTKIIKIPTNVNTALYQMGEGGTSMLVAGGLYLYGKVEKDYRALQTASDLTETFFSMGIATQVIKRISGRQSPFMAVHPGGDWHPFPSFHDFQTNTSNYDAFPSGHLATMMATVTVLALNYPEKKWIRVAGYTLMGLTGWAMMNTDVHWISDYPLALALGYVAGKITYERHARYHRLVPVP